MLDRFIVSHYHSILHREFKRYANKLISLFSSVKFLFSALKCHFTELMLMFRMGNVGYGILVLPGVFLDVADGLLGFATFILEIPQAYDGSGHEPDTSSDADGFSAFFGVALNDEPNNP